MMKGIYFILLILLDGIELFSQSVNLHKANAHALGADSYLTSPIHQNIGKIHAFALVLLFMMGLVATYKIYARWQLGEDDVLLLIVRWWGGIILCFFVLQFLRIYVSKQSFGEFSTISF